MQKKGFFLMVFALLLISFYASQSMPQGKYVWSGEGGELPNACVYKTRAVQGDNCYGDCPDRTTETGAKVKQCCDYKKDAQGELMRECVCKDNVNPCTDEKKCASCMAYAEAGGSNIDDSCMSAVMCALKNRAKEGSTHRPRVKTICEAVAQGNGQQFNPYKCVCNAKYPNQKYCKCCADQLTEDEKKEWEKAQNQYDALDCSGFDANTFNNAGDNSWASAHCKKVTPPDSFSGCAVFDFYQC